MATGSTARRPRLVSEAGMNARAPRLVMFEALDLGIDRLVPLLVARGADPDARHPTTHQHAHAIVLSRPAPDAEVLEPLFRSRCVIDAEIGAMVADPPQ